MHILLNCEMPTLLGILTSHEIFGLCDSYANDTSNSHLHNRKSREGLQKKKEAVTLMQISLVKLA